MRPRPRLRHRLPPRAGAAVAAAPALLAALLLAVPGAAAAQRAAPLRAVLHAEEGRLEADLDVGPALPADLERVFGNGLTNVVAVWVAVVPEGGGAPVARAGWLVEVLFDVWEESWVVTVRQPGLTRPVRRTVTDAAALRRAVAEVARLALGPAASLPPGRVVVEARVEVNPVSRELMARTREALASPSAGARPGAGSRSVLGAAASWFLREPDPGADQRLLRSAPIGRGEVAP